MLYCSYINQSNITVWSYTCKLQDWPVFDRSTNILCLDCVRHFEKGIRKIRFESNMIKFEREDCPSIEPVLSLSWLSVFYPKCFSQLLKHLTLMGIRNFAPYFNSNIHFETLLKMSSNINIPLSALYLLFLTISCLWKKAYALFLFLGR